MSKVRIVINVERNTGNRLFYAVLGASGSSIPTKNSPSQWFYEAGKALYHLPEEKLKTVLKALDSDGEVEVDVPFRLEIYGES